MAWIKTLAAVAALGIGASVFTAPVRAEEEKPKEEKPKVEKPEKKPMGPRLTQPWSWLTSLTDEQKTKINEIHKKSVEEQAKLREKEEADITALLTDEQKKELAAKKEEEAAKKKAPKEGEKANPEKKAEGEKNEAREKLRENMQVKPMPAPAPALPENGN